MSKTFEEWWDESGQQWAATRVEAGGALWTDDADERRELFNRRFVKPEPPKGMSPTKSIRSYQRNDDVRISIESDHRRTVQAA